MKALVYTNPDGTRHYYVNTADDAALAEEYRFRFRTWPNTEPRIVEVELREVADVAGPFSTEEGS